DPVALQPGATAGNGQAEEIRQLKAAVVHLQEQVNQLSSKPDPSNSQGRLTPPINPLPLFDPLSRDDPAPGQAASNQAKSEGEPAWRMHADWRDGLQIAAADEAFRVHVGGRLQFDSGWNAAGQAVQFGPGGIGELQDGAVFRRARIRIDGTMYEHFEWVAEFDFTNNVNNDTTASSTPIGSPSFTNVWAGVNDVSLLGTLRAGWMKEPIGFEHLTSSRWQNFMERAPGGDS